MNGRNIITVYLKELKDSLRDRRTLISTIVVPTVVMPVLFFGVGSMMGKIMTTAREEIPTVAILGGADSPAIVGQLRNSPKFHVVERAGEWRQLISEKKLRIAVDLPEKFQAGLAAGAAPAVKIYYYQGELKSDFAARAAEKFFTDLREQTVTDRLAEHGLPATIARPFEFQRENVAPPEKVGGNLVGGFIPYFIIMLCFVGAMYPAMDLTAGEKERGTMETLLCSPVARVDIVVGKFLMVLTGSLSAMFFMLLSMAVSAAVGGSLMIAGGTARTVFSGAGTKSAQVALPTIDPAGLLGVLAMVLPVAILFSAVIFTVALFAKSYKEAQSYVGPLVVLVILPAVIGVLPGIDLNTRLAFVPILNLSLVCRELLSGVWHWHYIAIIFGSSCLYAAIALALAVRMFKREDVIFRV